MRRPLSIYIYNPTLLCFFENWAFLEVRLQLAIYDGNYWLIKHYLYNLGQWPQSTDFKNLHNWVT